LDERVTGFRSRIEEIDREIVRLLQERVKVAIDIGRIKSSNSIPVADPAREKEVISHVLNTPHAPLDSQSLETLFLWILAICRKAQMHPHTPSHEE
jgi:chorismate mutase / prephenate dehydratase